MDTLRNLVVEYREIADELEALAASVEGASLYRTVAAEIEAAQDRYWNAELTLAEAAEESGYSRDYLGTLVRKGEIPNAGRKQAPRVKRSDLPRKPGLSATGCKVTSGPVRSRTEMARSVVESERGGHDG